MKHKGALTHTCPQAAGQREQRSSIFRAEVKFTHSEEKSAKTLDRSTQQGCRSPIPPFILFLVLWMGGGLFFVLFCFVFSRCSFFTILYNSLSDWGGIFTEKSWGVAWIASCCISFWSWALICLLKSLSIGLRAVFPDAFPYWLSTTHGRSYRAIISNLCIFIAHAPCFMLRVSCSDATTFLF